MRSRGAFLLFLLLLVFLFPVSSRGAGPLRRFSLAIYPSYSIGTFDSIYSHEYIPGPLTALPGSGASQVLTLRGSAEPGLALAFSYRLTESLALRLLVGRAASGITGENSSYVVIMRYASFPPPAYERRESTYDGTRPWVTTSGKLKTLSVAVGLEVGHDFSRLIRGAATFGAGLYRAWGDFGPLGYTTIWLGGHSVLMTENYLLYLKVPAGWKPGLDLGVELALAMGSGVSLSLRGGYALVATLTVVPVLDRVVNYAYLNEALAEEKSEIAAALSLGPLRLSPSAFRFGVGLGVEF